MMSHTLPNDLGAFILQNTAHNCMCVMLDQLLSINCYYSKWEIDGRTCKPVKTAYFTKSNKKAAKLSRKRKLNSISAHEKDEVATTLERIFDTLRGQLVTKASTGSLIINVDTQNIVYSDNDFEAWLQLHRMVQQMSSHNELRGTSILCQEPMSACELHSDDSDFFNKLVHNNDTNESTVAAGGLTFILPPNSSFLIGNIFELLKPSPSKDQLHIDQDNHDPRKFDLIIMDPPWHSKSVSRVSVSLCVLRCRVFLRVDMHDE
jgi:hypothetical protein